MKLTVLKDKSGGTYVQAATVILFLAVILSAVLFFAQSMTLAADVRKRVKITLDSYIVQKSIDIYHVVDDGEDYLSLDNQSAFDEYLADQFSGITRERDGSFRSDDGSYYLSSPVLSTSGEGRLRIYADFTLTVPVVFSGAHLFDMVIPMRVYSKFAKVF